jgi:16S rRNA (guanine966-N2)-methyltransferase
MIKRPYNNQALRIIGGQWSRRRIEFANTPEIRPTGDRLRETLFNWLQDSILDSDCLDLFAGSGILGLEALSRGANSCHFVDQSPLAINAIQSALTMLNTHKGTANQSSFPFTPINQSYDLIFLDPPFHRYPLKTLLNWIDEHNCLNPSGLIYFECPHPLNTDNNTYKIIKTLRYGQVYFGLLEKASS